MLELRRVAAWERGADDEGDPSPATCVLSEAKRILFVHASSGGLPPDMRVHLDLAGATSGVRCAVIRQAGSATPVDGDAEFIEFDFGRAARLDRVTPRAWRLVRRLARIVRSLPHTVAAARRYDPDIVYSGSHGTDMVIATLIARILHRSRVVHLHYAVGPWVRARHLWLMRTAQLTFSVSEFVRQTALLRELSADTVITVHNPAPSAIGVDQVSREAVRVREDIGPDAKVVIAAGRLDPGKGHELLLPAFRDLLEREPDAMLLVCGTSTWFPTRIDDLEALARRLEIGDAVRFLGFRSDISELLQASDVFCLPSEMEPFGLVYVEAMALGLPVVALRSGGVPEIVVDEQTGLLSAPGDVRGLAENLGRAISDVRFAERLGSNGAKRALTMFSADRLSTEWFGHLQRLAPAGS